MSDSFTCPSPGSAEVFTVLAEIALISVVFSNLYSSLRANFSYLVKMSYVDNGDDELDYEDEDYAEPGPAYGPATGAIAALAEDEMEEEQDYEDLYQDVEVGFFENTESGGAQAAVGQFSGENGVDHYGEEEYGEEYEKGRRNTVTEEENCPAEVQEDEDSERPRLAEIVRNGRVETEVGDCERPEDIVDEGRTAKVALEHQQAEGAVEDVEDDVVSEENVREEGRPSVPIQEIEEKPSVARHKQPPNVEFNKSVDYGGRTATGGSAGVRTPVSTDARNLGEEDSKVGRGVAVPTQPKPKVEGEQHKLESPGGKILADRGSKNFGGVDGPGIASSEGGAERGVIRSDGSVSGPSPAAPSAGRGGGTGPLSSGTVPPVPSTISREAPSSTASDHTAKHGGASHQHDTAGIMLFVGELHWWTTDAELEAALSEYGRVKNLKFFEEKASGRSKGYCQVEFYESGAARVCKEKMDGRVFNDRPCVVAFASPQTIKQMGAAQVGKNQIQSQHGSAAGLGRGRGEPASGARGPAGSQMGDGGRGYGREKMSVGGRGGGIGERGRGPGRGRGGSVVGRGGGGAHFGQGPPGPMGGGPGGMMPPQGIMGAGFDPAFGPPMGGRGGGYGMGPGGGFGPRAHPFAGPGMGPPFPTMGPGLPGVAPHVNPAFFGRANGNGPGLGMDGPAAGGWGEGPMPGWVGDEHERRMVYGDEMGGPDYGYPGEMGPDRLRSGPVRERDGEWTGLDRRRREDRGEDWGGERHRERGARDEYWDREQVREKDKEWSERERVSRGREKARAAAVEEDDRPRSRDEDFGKRRRMVADRKIER